MFSFIALLVSISVISQTQDIKVFLDCDFCEEDYYKQELSYVEFVRDRNYADVHLLFSKQSNASNGRHYMIDFIGKNKYAEINDKVEFDTTGETSKDEKRNIILNNLKFGLMRYWIKNGLKDKLTLQIEDESQEKKNEEVVDPWNKWTFKLSLRGYFNGQESSKSSYLNGSFRINRVTDKNKLFIRFGLSNSKSTYTYDDEDIVSERKSSYVYADDVISINNHLSAGLFINLGNSLYSNKAFYLSVKPGIEYNFFEYKDSQKKALYLTYKIGNVYNKYYDLTVFAKEKESLWQHNLELGGGVVTKWGNVSSSVSYRSYLHDAAINGFEAELNTSMRLFKGFSLNLYGSYGLSHDQINIRASSASLEDLLLAQKQIKSGYDYFGSIGISYTFGSIYNTIVNPRFDL